jgi:hypothetical protein
MPRARTTAAAGDVIAVPATAGLTGAGHYFESTGGGPSVAIQWLLWGGLLLGILLLCAAGVLAARPGTRPRR